MVGVLNKTKRQQHHTQCYPQHRQCPPKAKSHPRIRNDVQDQHRNWYRPTHTGQLTNNTHSSEERGDADHSEQAKKEQCHAESW